MKKLLITGITGMLGNSIYKVFSELNDYEIYGFSRNRYASIPNVKFLDLNNSSDNNFDVLIHCAAEIDVNLCEKNKQLAYDANVLFTQKVFSKFNSKKYIYISTDSVFDGYEQNYTEESLPNPINIYAKSKLLGEKTVEFFTDNYYIIRTNIYGFNTPLRNSLFEWGFKKALEKKEIDGYSNIYFNPLYIRQLSLLVYEIIKQDIKFGVYNLSSDEKVSKFEFLRIILAELGFNIDFINSNKYIINNEINRPLNTTLDNSKIKHAIPNFNYSLYSGIEMLKKDISII